MKAKPEFSVREQTLKCSLGTRQALCLGKLLPCDRQQITRVLITIVRGLGRKRGCCGRGGSKDLSGQGR